MPYIGQGARDRIDKDGGRPTNVGEVNYVMTRTIMAYLYRLAVVHYSDLNDVVDLLERLLQYKRFQNVKGTPYYQFHIPPETPLGLELKLYDILCDADATGIEGLRGVIRCVELELYRRVVAPYEDEKKEENGDVYQ